MKEATVFTFKMHNDSCEISGSHSCVAERYRRLGFYAVSICWLISTFWTYVSPSSESNIPVTHKTWIFSRCLSAGIFTSTEPICFRIGLVLSDYKEKKTIRWLLLSIHFLSVRVKSIVVVAKWVLIKETHAHRLTEGMPQQLGTSWRHSSTAVCFVLATILNSACVLSTIYFIFLVAFASSRSSVSLRVSARLQRDKFAWNFILGTFMKFCIGDVFEISYWGRLWNFILGTLWNSLEKLRVWLKYGVNIGHCPWSPKYLFMFAGDTKLHKSAISEWNSITLLGLPTRYKLYANAPQCYIMRVLPVLFSSVHNVIYRAPVCVSRALFLVYASVCQSGRPSVCISLVTLWFYQQVDVVIT
jgi:hypothetical protein